MTLLLSGGSGCIRSACTVVSLCLCVYAAACVDVASGGGGGGSWCCDLVLVLLVTVLFLVVAMAVVLLSLPVVFVPVVSGVIHVFCGGGCNFAHGTVGGGDGVAIVCVWQFWHSA